MEVPLVIGEQGSKKLQDVLGGGSSGTRPELGPQVFTVECNIVVNYQCHDDIRVTEIVSGYETRPHHFYRIALEPQGLLRHKAKRVTGLRTTR